MTGTSEKKAQGGYDTERGGGGTAHRAPHPPDWEVPNPAIIRLLPCTTAAILHSRPGQTAGSLGNCRYQYEKTPQQLAGRSSTRYKHNDVMLKSLHRQKAGTTKSNWAELASATADQLDKSCNLQAFTITHFNLKGHTLGHLLLRGTCKLFPASSVRLKLHSTRSAELSKAAVRTWTIRHGEGLDFY